MGTCVENWGQHGTNMGPTWVLSAPRRPHVATGTFLSGWSYLTLLSATQLPIYSLDICTRGVSWLKIMCPWHKKCNLFLTQCTDSVLSAPRRPHVATGTFLSGWSYLTLLYATQLPIYSLDICTRGVSWLKIMCPWHKKCNLFLTQCTDCDISCKLHLICMTHKYIYIYSISCLYFKHAKLIYRNVFSWTYDACALQMLCNSKLYQFRILFWKWTYYQKPNVGQFYWANPYLSKRIQESEWFSFERHALTPVYNYIYKTISTWQWHRK